MNLFSRILTFGEGRKIKKYEALVGKVNALEPAMQALSDEELSALAARLKERRAAEESLDALLPEAFAAVREASLRTLGLRHFDVTYGTASEFGFDYLRDNMATSAADRVQRGHAFAIVDEASTTPITSSGSGGSAEVA